MNEVYLVRHGSVGNPQNVVYGRMPGFGLSERGKKEAVQTARFLAGRGIEVLYHSPLERCVRTASEITGVLGIPGMETPGINEWDRDESLRDVQARMNDFWMSLYTQPYESIAAVSHRDPLRVLMLGLSGRSLSDVYKPEVFPLPPGGVWLLRPGRDGTVFENIFSPGTDLT